MVSYVCTLTYNFQLCKLLFLLDIIKEAGVFIEKYIGILFETTTTFALEVWPTYTHTHTHTLLNSLIAATSLSYLPRTVADGLAASPAGGSRE